MRAASLVLAAAAALCAQSPAALMGWGSENDPSDAPSRGMGDAGAALRSDRAWDPRLEARSAFATLTALEVQIAPGMTMVSDSKTSNTLSDGTFPRASLSIPLGRFGHLGLGYWKRFDRDFEWRSTSDTSIEVKGEGGAIEGDIAYGIAIPWVRGLALGVTYHRVLGHDRIMQDETFQADDEGSSATYSDTLEHSYWGDYWTGSVYFTRGAFDVGAWADFGGSIRRGTSDGGTYQQVEARADATVDPPHSLGGATAYRFRPGQALVADLSWTTWDKTVAGSPDQWKGGVGWQLSPSGDRFDDFWKRISWRAGAYGIIGGPQYKLTEAGTAGVGMPLGNLGTLDLGLQVGHNEVDNGGPKLKDNFVRLYVAITGTNSWGRSLRSHK